ncbi:ImuA family protein [Brevundimonas aurantiaca]|uniref:ImuA family protein n=1 Tax=Brevundimonas aurantiaca TaxID=74316 RepID=UPI002795BA2A|nr:damage-inducible protein [Brevundimonas aurantiaca]
MHARPSAELETLRARIRALEHDGRPAGGALPFGVPPLDAALPGGGLALGALHEVAGGGDGAVDGAAALFAAGIAARRPGQVLWCVTRPDLFAPALSQAGLGPDRVIYVEAGDEPSLMACFEEGLRHGGLGTVVAETARLSMTASRRLQLAAETSGALAGDPALAPRRRRRRLRPAHGRRHPLAGQPGAVLSPARSRRRPGTVVRRTSPLSRRRGRGTHPGSL